MPNRVKLWSKYPTIQQNHIRIKEGVKHLLITEPYPVMQKNSEVDVINQYESYITFNERFCKVNRSKLKAKIYITWSALCGDILGELDETPPVPGFTPYEEKIKGICVLGRTGHRSYPGNIYHLREEMAENLCRGGHLTTHVYASKSYGGSHYQGVAPGGVWGIECTKVVSNYLFNFCPENTHHPMWSYGYLTEKLFRSFKAKTVGLYLGCYNIHELIPAGLFIDLRNFYTNKEMDWERLGNYLVNFSKEKYIEMVEKAHEWNKAREYKRIEEHESLLKKVVQNESV